MGLKWGDIDLARGRLEVKRALQQQQGKGLVFVEPKSKSSRRAVTLGEVAVSALGKHEQQQRLQREMLGPEWQDSDLVFTTETGRPYSPEAVNWQFTNAFRRAGLPRIRVHDLRHTAASLLLAQGIHPKVVQEMLGHSTITLTLSTYSHVLPSLHRDAAKAMDSLFGNDVSRRDRGLD